MKIGNWLAFRPGNAVRKNPMCNMAQSEQIAIGSQLVVSTIISCRICSKRRLGGYEFHFDSGSASVPPREKQRMYSLNDDSIFSLFV